MQLNWTCALDLASDTSMLCTTWYSRLAKLLVDTGNKLELKTADIL